MAAPGQMSVRCLLVGENSNVYPMQTRFIIKLNVQGLQRVGGKHGAALDTVPGACRPKNLLLCQIFHTFD